jgi:hypothetical protein
VARRTSNYSSGWCDRGAKGYTPRPLVQGRKEVEEGHLDAAVARALWYMPDIGPGINDRVKAGEDPASISTDEADRWLSPLSMTFNEAYTGGESSIHTWADVQAIVKRDAKPLDRPVTLARGTFTTEDPPSVGDLVGGRGMMALTSDPAVADAFARRYPPPPAQHGGANPVEAEMMDHLMEQVGDDPNSQLSARETPILWSIDMPAGTPLWALENDLEEFVLPEGWGVRIKSVDRGETEIRIHAVAEETK